MSESKTPCCDKCCIGTDLDGCAGTPGEGGCFCTCKPESKTPETDALCKADIYDGDDMIAHARKLELERDEARVTAKAERVEAVRERDALRAELAKLVEKLELIASRAEKAESRDNRWSYQYTRFGREIARDIRQVFIKQL